MKESFEVSRGLIMVGVEIFGTRASAKLGLALDTGATSTLIRPVHLQLIGCDPALASERVQVTTGSGVETTPRVSVSKISALGCTRDNFPVLAHTLPPSATVDGLLGLDFLRGGRLGLDFRSGIVDFEI